MKINQARVGKSNTRMKILFVFIGLVAFVYLIPGHARAAMRFVKHQPIPLIIETSAYRNLHDDFSSDMYLSQSDDSSSDDEESNDDDEEDDDDWEA
jgi:hypothetical protein